MTFTNADIARLRMALGRISRSVDRQVPGDGLSPTQLIVLGAVARKGSIGMGELADTEAINPTMLSRIVGKLEAGGLVARRADAADGRAVRVEITAAGTRLHKRRRQGRNNLFAGHISELPADVGSSLLEALPALEALADHLNVQLTSGRGA
jgi:DNA-binding MarR family transcriptional regulator